MSLDGASHSNKDHSQTAEQTERTDKAERAASLNPSAADTDVELYHRMELQQSLRDLRVTTNSTTARLDDTYYSVLEKFSTLQHTVSSLQELVSEARKLNADFIQKSQSVTKEVEDQIDTLEDYASQAERLAHYQSRLSEAREKALALTDRADGIRSRAEAWSKGEAQWEEKTRRRIKLFWGLSAAVLLVLMGLLIFQYTPTRQVAGPGGKNFSVPEVVAAVGGMNESRVKGKEEQRVLEELRGKDGPLEEDPRLRIFDEL